MKKLALPRVQLVASRQQQYRKQPKQGYATDGNIPKAGSRQHHNVCLLYRLHTPRQASGHALSGLQSLLCTWGKVVVCVESPPIIDRPDCLVL